MRKFKNGDKVICNESWTKGYGIGTIMIIDKKRIGVRFSNYTQYDDENFLDYHYPSPASLKLANSYIIKERLGIK